MRLAVITPVGPGHLQYADECSESISAAWSTSRGPFEHLQHTLVIDDQGKLGRSRARNNGMLSSPDADWFMFLDADDLCLPNAFKLFGDVLSLNRRLSAVFGAIYTDRHGVIPENVMVHNWGELMRYGAVGTLSMGFFCRASDAREVKWDESMDVGEDFDFYVRLLRDHNWMKIEQPLVKIRLDVPSAVGPRGYVTLDWWATCQKVIDRERL